ncbi:MAG TPA: glycosyl hydrolase [Terriglobales bacterium]|nr:glycosyl hydrolase [Terriglobales bacterium]
MFRQFAAIVFVISVATIPASPQGAGVAELRSAFQSPPPDCRIMMRWWWFGPSVIKSELERELRAMKDAGIGGVEIQPVYPLALDDPQTGFHNFPYLSDEFIDDLHFAAEKARELGLRFDVTLGSGWPFGGPHIPVTQAAGKLRVVPVQVEPGAKSIAVPDISAGEKLLAAFVSVNGKSPQMLNLEGIHSGRIPLSPSANSRSLTWFIASRTGQMVKRAAIGAEGFVLDHFDQAAIENHLRTVGDRLLSAFGDHPPYAVFSDSLEVYASDWTGDLLGQFQKRRGYDLTPYLPALVQDIGPQTADIRHDWGRTLTELADERYLVPLREWAAKNGTHFRSQTYGIPPVSLSSNNLVDLIEGEGDDWQGFTPTRWASSASHIYGHNITSSETWTWLHSPAFRATPLDMKADADRFFLEGVNQLVGHGWPYSPPGVPEPGWSFYAAGVWDDHNPWWPVMPELTQYLQRVSFLLRQGKPITDVAVLVPTDDAWSQFTPGNDSLSETVDRLLGQNLIPQILDAGFNFDFIDAEAIDKPAINYKILILPDIGRLSLKTYQEIQTFAEHGGVVIATKALPSRAPGFIESERDTPGIKRISQWLFEQPEAKGDFVADEKQLATVLAKHATPDVSLNPNTHDLGFVHRSLSSADVYFLVNTSNRRLLTRATFRTQRENPEWWDPFSGVASIAGTGSAVAIDLAPYESRTLVFSDETPPASERASIPANQLGTPKIIDTGWTVTFPELHRSLQFAKLHSWSDDYETRFYSGSATYENNFSIAVQSGQRIYLDFGPGTPTNSVDKHQRFFAGLDAPIREAAQIFVNHQSAGFLWKPPYRLDITTFVRPGENHLRIVVYNTAINELAGRALRDYRLLNSRYGERFTPQDVEGMKPLPSGLLTAPHLVFMDR